MQYRIRHDFSKSQPRWNYDYIEMFGPNNEGAIIDAETAKDAVAKFNDPLLPGRRCNPFYLKVEEIK